MQFEKIAKVLEASARYTEALEKENQLLKGKINDFEKRAKEAAVSPILSRVEAMTGKSLDNDLKEKLANSQELLDLMDHLSKEQSVIEPMGDVSQEKVASDKSHLKPDDRFARWATGQSDTY